jgi:hypothetical protein
VSQGSTKPGAQVTAGWDGQAFQLFLADPGGGVYTARGTAAHGWGPWNSVSQGSTTPGAPVTAVWDGKAFQLFLADPLYRPRHSRAGLGPLDLGVARTIDSGRAGDCRMGRQRFPVVPR